MKQYGTQGGGVVYWDEQQKQYLFSQVPGWGEFNIGDPIPPEWGIGGEVNVL